MYYIQHRIEPIRGEDTASLLRLACTKNRNQLETVMVSIPSISTHYGLVVGIETTNIMCNDKYIDTPIDDTEATKVEFKKLPSTSNHNCARHNTQQDYELMERNA